MAVVAVEISLAFRRPEGGELGRVMSALSVFGGPGSWRCRSAGRNEMFRRPIVVLRRRLLGAALVGGLGFAAGRASGHRAATAAPGAPSVPPARPADLTTQLRDLADLHASGALSDDEFSAAKSRLLGS